jgi:hypothetical protein
MSATLSTPGVAGFFGSRATRYLGIYLAGSAGGLQVMDVLSERFALPDRLFLGTMIMLILGVPLVAGVALVLDVARGERAPSPVSAGAWPGVRTRAAGTAATNRSGETSPALRSAAPAANESSEPAGTGEAGNAFALALVHHRLAVLYDDAGEGAEAATQYRRFLALSDRAVDEHSHLVEAARARLAALEADST